MRKRQIARLKSCVEYLCSLDPPRNCWNFESLSKCRTYIAQELEGMKYGYELQLWKARGNEYANIITRYGDPSKPKLIVGTHYEVYGNMPGADDNASGVAGLLEILRILKSSKQELDYCIEVVFYCLEEPPFFGTDDMGSYIHAKSLVDSGNEIKGMVCLDMIGYFSDEVDSQNFPTQELSQRYPSTANFIVAVGIKAHETFLNHFYEGMLPKAEIDIQKIAFNDSDGLAGLSDQRNYWNFNIPALMINNTAFLRNANYHQETDLPETLDYKKMAAVVNSVARAIQTL
ncbi:MAG: M28 family peptidase [Crocinitomicaceae bacterium]|nr:M28 family peptidase [Crocinitomicaceae bacterium]